MSESDALEMKAMNLLAAELGAVGRTIAELTEAIGSVGADAVILTIVKALSPPPPAVGEIERLTRENADLRKIMDAMQRRHESQLAAIDLLTTPSLTPQGGQ